MSIDSSALTSIQSAISASTLNAATTRKSSDSDRIATITAAAAESATMTRARVAFEDKMKAATNSDTVELSSASLEALEKYNQTGSESAAAKEEEAYSYDYATLRKQRLANEAAIEQEVSEKYGSGSSAASDEGEAESA
ncbi:MAG: hypothetical protein K6A65_07215 [Succinivibrionaceae bacterium]|nr:hypothetical protein [Succinivibrionaceae bacterium]